MIVYVFVTTATLLNHCKTDLTRYEKTASHFNSLQDTFYITFIGTSNTVKYKTLISVPKRRYIYIYIICINLHFTVEEYTTD